VGDHNHFKVLRVLDIFIGVQGRNILLFVDMGHSSARHTVFVEYEIYTLSTKLQKHDALDED
jgi:hypothetical protein